jgi:hypothetical protein
VLCSSSAWEDLSPLERFFQALANADRLREREWVWESKFGSCACPVCKGRGHLYWTDEGGDFRFGCKERCDRDEILGALGLDAFDVMVVTPKWLMVH